MGGEFLNLGFFFSKNDAPVKINLGQKKIGKKKIKGGPGGSKSPGGVFLITWGGKPKRGALSHMGR